MFDSEYSLAYRGIIFKPANTLIKHSFQRKMSNYPIKAVLNAYLIKF